ncbi:MAG: 4-(cytidine 5'-diphospho)-2-C-methyl-D-erythritol kinase, partial [Desulfuromonadaceae bacterium]
ATVLLTLNRLLELHLSRPELMQLGLSLGADVPFFVCEQTAWASGIGEQLQPAPVLPSAWYVLVNPKVSVSTAQVYGKLGLTSPGHTTRLPRFPGTIAELVEQLHNDLERVTVAEYPVVAEIKQRLLELGAVGALLSGRGPTGFGVFSSATAAVAAAAALAGFPWKVYAVEPL